MKNWKMVGFLMSVVTSSTAWAAPQTGNQTHYYQPPDLKSPTQGSLAGVNGTTRWEASDLSKGSFSLPLGMNFPEERGPLLLSIIPAYSPQQGIGEWGLGFSNNLSIRRFRPVGSIDFKTDDLLTPWGHFVQAKDGDFYPLGLAKPIRLKLISPNKIVAYLQDGSIFRFDGLVGVNSRIYEWFLVEASNTNHQMSFYRYEKSAQNYVYLKEVSYGGAGQDTTYRISLDYEAVKQPYITYRSTEKQTLTSRVNSVRFSSKNGNGSFEDLFSYKLKYQELRIGQGFYLKSLQKFFVKSSEKEPILSYEYNDPYIYIKDAKWIQNSKLDPIITKFGQSEFDDSLLTAFDSHQDGRLGFEISRQDHDYYRQTDTGFVHEPLPPLDKNARVHPCRAPDVKRNVMKFRGFHSDFETIVLQESDDPHDVTTDLIVCGLDGKPKETLVIPYDWTLNETTRLVDINHDGRPDLVKEIDGQIYILENQSTPDHIAFAKEPIHQILFTDPDELHNPFREKVSAIYLQDLNGDGIPDLILRYSSTFLVWYGKGNFEFEKNYVLISFFRNDELMAPDRRLKALFQDLTGDGIADVIFYGSHCLMTFLFDGSRFVFNQFHALDPKVFSKMLLNPEEARPIFGDFLGTGNPQVLTFDSKKAYSLEYSQPGSGLLSQSNDGKGNVLKFEYSRAKAEKGIGSRPTILKKLEIHSAGKGVKTYEYDYSESVTHSISQALLGFNQVSIHEGTRHLNQTFEHQDFLPTLPISTVEMDMRIPQLQKYRSHEYELTEFEGIPFKQLKTDHEGFQKSDVNGSVTNSKIEKTRSYLSYQSIFCPSWVREEDAHSTLETQTSYDFAQDLKDHLTCFPKSLSWKGLSSSGASDFSENLLISRDKLGHPLSLSSPSEGGIVFQEIKYRPDFKVESVTTPGKGSTLFEYDSSHHLISIKAPDQVRVEALYSNTNPDQVIQLNTFHGSSVFSQFFGYDGLSRLNSIWNNLFNSSPAHPLESFQYQFATSSTPGWIQSNKVTSFGETPILRNEFTYFSGAGDSLGTSYRSDLGWVLKDYKTIFPDEEKTLIYPAATFANSADLLASFASQSRPMSEKRDSDLLGSSLFSETAFTKSSTQKIETDIQIADKTLATLHHENGRFLTRAENTLDGNRSSLTDEEGKTYHFEHDAFSRLKKVTLPQGEHHSISRDSLGRVIEVTRPETGVIRYSYLPGTELVQKKQYLNRSGTLARSVDFEYDSTGRIVKQIEQAGTSSAVVNILTNRRVLEYLYDGKVPSGSIIPGQVGFLTAVKGPDFTRIMRYRSDGKLIHTQWTLSNWGQFEESLTYHPDGSVATSQVSSTQGGSTTSYTQSFEQDSLGRLSSVLVNQKALANLKYNSLSFLEKVEILTDNSANETNNFRNYHYDTFTQRLIELNGKTNGKIFGTSWDFDDRGLITSESLLLGQSRETKDYTFSPNASLLSERTSKGVHSYQYNLNELLASEETGSHRKTFQTSLDEWQMNKSGKEATPKRFKLDGLGRVLSAPGYTLTYGPSGRVEHLVAEKNNPPISFGYDENGKRLWKKINGQFAEVYFDDRVIIGSRLLKPFKIQGVVLGVLDGPQFIPLASDHRGSILEPHTSDQASSASLQAPTAYGERSTRLTEVSSTIDYASQGYDPDLHSYRMDQRDYHPGLKRFLTPDPLFLEHPEKCIDSPKECNLYGYAKANPVSFVDPTGLMGAAPHVIGAGISLGFWAYHEVNSSHVTSDSIHPTSSPIDFAAGAGGAAIGGRTTSFFTAGEGRVVVNPVPDTFARVIPGELGAAKTLGGPHSVDVFVTGAQDIKGLNASQIADRLTIPESSSFRVIEFPSSGVNGVASPILRENPGFIGGGQTAGGAREFVIPNQAIPENATSRIVH